MRTVDFFYDLPEGSIAQRPIEPRHAARLLDTRTMTDRVFSDLPTILAEGDLLVVNRTRVRAARLMGRKTETGGAVEALLLDRTENGRWEALVRPARRIRAGVSLAFPGISAVVVADPVDGRCIIELSPVTNRDIEDLIEEAGEVPLPPYIHTPLEDPGRYQTVFAGDIGSAAAPTAGLHFSEDLLAGLVQRGVEIAYVDLHVGLDTFRPISAELIEDHRMHSEWVTVPEATCAAIAAARNRKARVVAVGTTVVRSLESAAAGEGVIEPLRGPTDLFIRPGYRFRVVDAVITNFHVPGSTLVVLIAALLGARWRTTYETALERGYRFLSFGDAMYMEVDRG
jgi:S-adenosylmethionine:tRNA ribosyltransferase-isomerase